MPNTYAYAVVYNNNGDFIITRKNEYSYYYTSFGSSNEVIPAGQSLMNRGGTLECFPGGKLQNNNAVFTACQEFFEETGCNIQLFAPVRPVTSVPWPSGADLFYGIYIKVTPQDFSVITQTVAAALGNGQQLAMLIRAGAITSANNLKSEAIRRSLTPYAMDNELDENYIWNCNDPAVIAAINGWTNQYQGWFSTIFTYLRGNYQH